MRVDPNSNAMRAFVANRCQVCEVRLSRGKILADWAALSQGQGRDRQVEKDTLLDA